MAPSLAHEMNREAGTDYTFDAVTFCTAPTDV